MITYENICRKLGFDALSYQTKPKGTEYDGEEQNPFSILSIEELDFLTDYFRKNRKDN